MRCLPLDAPLDVSDPVVTVGTFDGVHLGHRVVLETVQAKASACGGSGVVVTFSPHPRTVIDPLASPGVLTLLEEKQRCIEPLGIDLLAVVRFTLELRMLSPEAFVEDYLIRRLGARAVVVGYDHGFGRDRGGSPETMESLGRRHGFEVISVPPYLVDGEPISSTRIRRHVSRGDLEEVSRLMGRGYPVVGRVVQGDQRGLELGFPTANVVFDEPDKLLPPDGVYAAWTYLPDRRPAVLNLGYRPTFNGESRTIEVHVLDFAGDLYGKMLALEVVHHIRDEKRFSSQEALISQIRGDRETAREILSHDDVTPLRR